MAGRKPIGELWAETARNGDRVAVVRVPRTLSHTFGPEREHLIVTINGQEVSRPRTEREARDEAVAILAARQHGY